MKKQFKFIDVEVKKATEAEHSFWFTASTADRDRDGDIIVPEKWKLQNYKKNPVVLYGHNYYSLPIGKAIDVKVENGKLRSLIQFAGDIDEFAARVENMVAAGFLKTVSVGFMVYKAEELTEEDRKQRPENQWGKRLHAELLEISVVPVPANPAALRERDFCDLVAKGFGVQAPEAEEKKSPLLPYEKDGQVDHRLLKASMAALAGARGGVPIPEEDRKACLKHLLRVWNAEGLAPIEHATNPTQEELKEKFSDVWHDELLDVVQAGLEEEDREILPLIKGQTRDQLAAATAALKAAHDSLTKLMQASEEKPAEPEPVKVADPDLAETVKAITTNLAAVNAALK